MAKIWIRVITNIQVEEGGCRVTYRAGDWVKVGKHQARLLVSQGCADIPNILSRTIALDLAGCGVVATGEVSVVESLIEQTHPGLEVMEGTELLFPKTLLWDGEARLRTNLLPVGFHRLATGWRVASPIPNYDLLAENIGTEEERKYTKSIIRDLRVPVYETRILFLLRCPECKELLNVWKEEREHGENDRLAFLRAFYKVKPIMCALPSTWLW